MINWIFTKALRILLHTRYKITVQGLDKIKAEHSILFLPNHVSLSDPILMTSILYPKFQPRPMADMERVHLPIVKQLVGLVNPIFLPDMNTSPRSAKNIVVDALDEAAAGLIKGDNILLYPSGALCKTTKEKIGGRSGVRYLLDKAPDTTVVTIRISGLWGSSSSWASGKRPEIFSSLKLILVALITNLFVFIPKREVLVEVESHSTTLNNMTKIEVNNFLEKIYNDRQEPEYFVPYHKFLKPRKIEPFLEKTLPTGSITDTVSPEIINQVISQLRLLTGINNIDYRANLSSDLGVDSLTMIDLATWIETEFGIAIENTLVLDTVENCILAAAGQIRSDIGFDPKPAEAGWFKIVKDETLEIPDGKNIGDVFLQQLLDTPDKVILADQISGVKTYRDIATAIFVLAPEFKKIKSEYVGIMLPASNTAAIVYFALMFAGKIPVQLNWTVGVKGLSHSINALDIAEIITASPLINKLEDQGFDFVNIEQKFLKLDLLAGDVKITKKILAKAKSYFSLSTLKSWTFSISDTAVVLFTSGSEAIPKAVPLSHKNILANVNDAKDICSFRTTDKLMGILPPFHSFGFTGTTILPVLLGMPVVYHANPTEGSIINRLIGEYHVTVLVGTPTFVTGILNGGEKNNLTSLRFIITGAEKCQDYLFEQLKAVCPDACICEGYGITECSPIISANKPNDSKQGSIGKIISSMDYKIVDPDTLVDTERGNRGKLLVAGPSVFDGYLKFDGESPFINLAGQQWYDTKDLVVEDYDGFITFLGRLKRFIKVGGEMISLPAIEEVFNYLNQDEQKTVAVDAVDSSRSQIIVLFTTDKGITREQGNVIIKQSGLSALHNIRKIHYLDEIPLLGTGKINYVELRSLVE